MVWLTGLQRSALSNVFNSENRVPLMPKISTASSKDPKHNDPKQRGHKRLIES